MASCGGLASRPERVNNPLQVNNLPYIRREYYRELCSIVAVEVVPESSGRHSSSRIFTRFSLTSVAHNHGLWHRCFRF
jgi:hypothetical protein